MSKARVASGCMHTCHNDLWFEQSVTKPKLFAVQQSVKIIGQGVTNYHKVVSTDPCTVYISLHIETLVLTYM